MKLTVTKLIVLHKDMEKCMPISNILNTAYYKIKRMMKLIFVL